MRVFKVTVTKTDPVSGEKVRLQSRKWYGQLPGSTKRVPLSQNKTVAQQMLAELVKKADLAKVGIVDPFEQHRGRPLAEHLADFEASLRAKGSTAKQVRQKIGRVRRVLNGCGFVLMADLSASRVQQYLAGLKDNGRPLPPLEPGKDSFTRNELAAAIGVKPETVNTLVRRHGLEASGNGKARRFPRSTVAALQERLGRGAGVQTANYYLREIKAFCRWLVADRRMGDNPLAYLQGGNAKHDRRHDRRPLSLEELQAIVQAARRSGVAYRGLTGPNRAMLYSVACATGFRAAELGSLAPAAFDLTADPPAVTLSGEHAKNGKTAVQPLPADVAAALRGYLAGRAAGLPVWPGSWVERAAEMFRLDLDAAGIPYVTDGPDGPLYADFHSLRHSFVALLDQSGASLKQAMQLARHSDPRLTMARYGRAQLNDLGATVRRLPSVLGGAGGGEALEVTGTDPFCQVCTEFVQTSDAGSGGLRLAEADGGRPGEKQSSLNPLPFQGVEADEGRLMLVEESSGGWDRTSDTRLMKPLL